MTPIRATTSPPLPLAARDRPRPGARPAVQPVRLEREVEADRRRSLREELDAADEHVPTDAPEFTEAAADPATQLAAAHELAGELERLGGDALRLLQPLPPEVRQLADGTHVDEQA